VYIDQGCFVAVQDRALPAPAGFSGVPVVETGGILFPGLIELHNHLSYNALPMWSVPKLFQHRDQWSIHKDYRPMISGPMTVIGQSRNSLGQAALLPALVRYVECKCLLGGVTTTQGVMLASNAGVQRFYRGLIRNVEQTDDPTLLEAQGRIADVVAKDAKKFLTRLKKEDSCFLLHLSEGVTDPAKPLSVARKHFLALEIAKDEWALNGVLRHPLRRPAARRLRHTRPEEGVHDLVTAQQPAPVWRHGARGCRSRGGCHDRAGQRLVAHRQQEPAR
jgi:hypothetical protein